MPTNADFRSHREGRWPGDKWRAQDMLRLEPSGIFFLIIYLLKILFFSTYLQLDQVVVSYGSTSSSGSICFMINFLNKFPAFSNPSLK